KEMTMANARLSKIKDHLAETGGNAAVKSSANATPFAARTTHTIERMARERAQASFPVREMTYFLDGGKEMTALKEGMMAELAANPVFVDPDWHDVSRDQLLIRDGADVARRNARLEIHALHDLGGYCPVHSSLPP
ncbi:peroxisomal acyl-coenzyme a oxidase 1 isoform x1, partial [Nannochloropsis oceanica]